MEPTLIFESRLLRGALGKQLSETLGKIYRELTDIAGGKPAFIEGERAMRLETRESDTIRAENMRILELMETASQEFFAKMRSRITKNKL